jgi:hypothetical protein
MDEIRFENGSTFSIYESVCHGFHNPFHNKMASADALTSTRSIRACSRVKPTTETKNSASKVMRVTLKSPIEAQPARGLIEPEENDQLGFGVRWASPGRLIARAFLGGGICERRLVGESAHFRAGKG